MTTKAETARLATGVRNLDELLDGGLPKGSVTVFAGPPGAGKTILTQQICFHNGTAETRVLYFNTLSEPTAKTLRYLSQFSFFDAKKLGTQIEFVDVGATLRTKGLDDASKLIMEHVRRVQPAIVVVDSFKVFDDLARSNEDRRKFDYELAVNLMTWEATVLILGEYGPRDIEANPLFSIIDGLVTFTQREESGEQQRFIRISKMRGTNHSREEHAFSISSSGIEVFAPRVTIHRQPASEGGPRRRTNITKLDDLMPDGIPAGSSLLVSGVAGTGKTALSLEFLYRGALAGEKGIYFSFEETEERLRATARSFGWEFDRQIESGMITLVFIPQPEIMVESQLLVMQERVVAMSARRIVVDSLSVFLHKIKDAQLVREKTFQLASVVQNAGAVGFFVTDIPYGSLAISRFGVEETVVDGIILLSSTEEGYERQRYLEVYKMRNTAHLKGRHGLVVGRDGVSVFPRYSAAIDARDAPRPLEPTKRLRTGVPGLDELLDGGVLDRSVTLVSGSAGIGKTTLALQFALGATTGEPAVYVTLEEGPAQLITAATAIGIPLEQATKDRSVELVYLARERVRANQLLALLEDKIVATNARRVVLDDIGHILATESDLRDLLLALTVRFKALGVTSLLALEASSLYSSDVANERSLSPFCDNLVMLRYADTGTELSPYLVIVKTRSSTHDRSRHRIHIQRGGLRIEAVVPKARARSTASRARRPKKKT